MKHIIIIIFAVVVCNIPNCSFSQTAAGFLETTIGAEAQGQGNAFTCGVSPISTYWNPSGISYLTQPSFFLQHTKLSLDVRHNFMNYIYPLQKFAVGFSIINSEIGGIEIRSAENFTLIPDAIVKSKENAYILSVAKMMNDKFKIKNKIDIDDEISVGINYKYISQDVYNGSAKGNGFDVGMLYRRKNGLSVGMMFQEVAGKIKWNTGRKDTIPLNIRFGISKKFLQNKLTTSFDVGKRRWDSIKYFFGSEYSIEDIVKIRAGLDDGRFAMGVGFNIDNFQIDYSYKKDNLFGDTQKFTITHKLWKEIQSAKVETKPVEPEVKVEVEKKIEEQEKEIEILSEEKPEVIEEEILSEEVPSKEITEVAKTEVDIKPVEPEVKVETKEQEIKPLPGEKVEIIQLQPVEKAKTPTTFAMYITSVKGNIVKFHTGEGYKIGDTLLIRAGDGKIVGKCEVISIGKEISIGKILSYDERIYPFSYYVTNY